jgi:hypothetical protein
MLDTIGESAVRMTTRTETNLAVDNKDVALQKVEKAVEERPIESSQETAKPESDVDQKRVATRRMTGAFSLKNMIKKGMSSIERHRNKSP